MDFGERLKELRTERGLTMPELAEAAGVTKQAIFRYEKGVAIPNTLTLTWLAKTLGCTSDYLIGLSDERN